MNMTVISSPISMHIEPHIPDCVEINQNQPFPIPQREISMFFSQEMYEDQLLEVEMEDDIIYHPKGEDESQLAVWQELVLSTLRDESSSWEIPPPSTVTMPSGITSQIDISKQVIDNFRATFLYVYQLIVIRTSATSRVSSSCIQRKQGANVEKENLLL